MGKKNKRKKTRTSYKNARTKACHACEHLFYYFFLSFSISARVYRLLGCVFSWFVLAPQQQQQKIPPNAATKPGAALSWPQWGNIDFKLDRKKEVKLLFRPPGAPKWQRCLRFRYTFFTRLSRFKCTFSGCGLFFEKVASAKKHEHVIRRKLIMLSLSSAGGGNLNATRAATSDGQMLSRPTDWAQQDGSRVVFKVRRELFNDVCRHYRCMHFFRILEVNLVVAIIVRATHDRIWMKM